MPRKANVRKENRAQGSAVADHPEPLQQPEQANPAATSPGGRDALGRFLPGAPAGPGNPHARHCARMLEMFRNAISDDEMYYLCRMLWDKACKGDMSAIKFIWSYKIGKPPAAPNPDLIDRDEWDHYQKDAMTMDEMKEVLGRLPSRVGNAMVGAAQPSMAHSVTQNLARQLTKGLPKSTRDAIAASDSPANGPENGVQGGEKTMPETEANSGAKPHQTATHRRNGPISSSPLDANPTCSSNRAPVESVPNGKREGNGVAARSTDQETGSSPQAAGSERPTKRKNGGKLVAQQWLQPLARQVNASKRQGKKRKLAHA